MQNNIERAEADFRWRYDRVYERSIACYNSCCEDAACTNICHYLIADDNGYLPVLGIDCDVSVLCCSGDDIDNSTIEAYCAECALAQQRSRQERKLREEAESHARREAAARIAAVEEQQKRTLSEFWT